MAGRHGFWCVQRGRAQHAVTQMLLFCFKVYQRRAVPLHVSNECQRMIRRSCAVHARIIRIDSTLWRHFWRRYNGRLEFQIPLPRVVEPESLGHHFLRNRQKSVLLLIF